MCSGSVVPWGEIDTSTSGKRKQNVTACDEQEDLRQIRDNPKIITMRPSSSASGGRDVRHFAIPTNKQIQVITQEWRVRELSLDVVERGPWKIVGRGDEARLKLHYRRALAREGYCVVQAKAPLYRPRSLGQTVH